MLKSTGPGKAGPLQAFPPQNTSAITFNIEITPLQHRKSMYNSLTQMHGIYMCIMRTPRWHTTTRPQMIYDILTHVPTTTAHFVHKQQTHTCTNINSARNTNYTSVLAHCDKSACTNACPQQTNKRMRRHKHHTTEHELNTCTSILPGARTYMRTTTHIIYKWARSCIIRKV